MKATVHIFLKAGVLDVQGKAVEGALNGLAAASNWSDVSNVRVGKVLEFDVKSPDKAAAEAEVKTMCEKLLANTVIESYRIDIS